ncbi:hypothetical protein [Halorubrum ezzemoulense]|uniref:hypothetical protein n=1 Tax=Halorubrum ezzemoulense TaxID=337243 RepID=UPI00117B8F87|nr:hypothetical protein [Halorubrum ezzemoulense]
MNKEEVEEIMMETKLEGEWIDVERTVPDEVGQDIIRMAVENSSNGDGATLLSVSGDDSSFESQISDAQVSAYVDMVANLGDGDNSEQDSLPDDFFERLSTRQRIFLEILLKSDGPVTGPEIREKMRSEYDQEVSDSGSGTAGIISGLTRKYGKEFRGDLIGGRVSHHNDEDNRVFEHWIGEKYEEDLRDYFDF